MTGSALNGREPLSPSRGRADENRLVADMIELARQYGRYGHRRISALLREVGWAPLGDANTACRQRVNDKRVERLWRREELKVPMKQRKKRRLWPIPLGTLPCNALPGSA